MATKLPEYPWQVVEMNLLELDQCHYLIVTDYFSRYPQVLHFTDPQYGSQEFAKFAEKYEFHRISSSLKLPQSNGHAE